MPVRVDLSTADGDQLRSLLKHLRHEDELRGSIRLLDAPPLDGHLGPLAEALQVAVDSSGAFTVLAGALVTWVRTRGSDVSLSLTDDMTGKSVNLDAKRIRRAGARELQELASDLAQKLRTMHDPPSVNDGP